MQPRKQHILEVSKKLFHRLGYFQTGIAEINKEAAVSKGVFYHYFPNGKQQLVKEVLQSDYQDFYDELTEYFSNNNAIDATKLFIGNLKRNIDSPSDTSLRVNVLVYEVKIANDIDPEILEISKKNYSLIEKLLTKKLISQGYSETSAQIKSQKVNMMIEGAISIGLVQDTSNYFDILENDLDSILS